MASVYKPKGSAYWSIEFTDAIGKRRRISSKARGIREARSVADHIEAQVYLEEFGGAHVAPQRIRDEWRALLAIDRAAPKGQTCRRPRE